MDTGCDDKLLHQDFFLFFWVPPEAHNSNPEMIMMIGKKKKIHGRC